MTNGPEIFEPVPPEPGMPDEPDVPLARARRGAAASPRWVSVVLGAALVVAVAGVAFGAGRISAGSAQATLAGASGVRGGAGLPGGSGVQGGPGIGGQGVPGGDGGASGRGFGFGDDGGRGFRGAGIQGTVSSISGDSMTVTLADGRTVTVALGGSTTYHRQTTASAGDVTNGSRVVVRIDVQSLRSGATTPAASDVTVLP